MGRRRPYIGPSESQADAMARREAPYSVASEASIRAAWDYRHREPTTLREAVRMVRAAYADEVPTKLHDSAIGPDGTPRFAVRAEGYIFGSPTASDGRRDPGTGEPDAVSWYHTPFRAALAHLGDSPRAAIVRHITIGSQGPAEAAIAEGVPAWCAKLVAHDTLLGFLRQLSDVRITTAA